MRRWIFLCVSLGLGALIAWWVFRDPSLLAPAVDGPALHSGAATEAVEELPAEPPQDGADRRASVVVDAAPAVEKPVVPSSSAHDAQAEIRGRFLLPDGNPAAGVQLTLSGRLSSSTTFRLRESDNFELPSVESGADGRFLIRFDVRPDLRTELVALLGGHGTMQWNWFSPTIQPRGSIDLGDIQLERAGSVRGRLVDSRGRAIAKGWTVRANTSTPNGANRTYVARVSAPLPPSGEFLIENIPPGNARLRAGSELGTWVDGPAVEISAGVETQAEIRFDGPDLASRIQVFTKSTPFSVFDGDVNENEIVLRADGANERVASRNRGSVGSFAFDAVAPGSYTVVLHDPRYLPWSQSDVVPGSVVRMPLIGNVILALRVVDDETGAPISRYALDVRLDALNHLYKTFHFFDERHEPPQDGSIAGILPIVQTVIVQATGHASLEIPLTDLVANERRTVEARLARGGILEGRVVGAATGLPVEGAKLQLAPTRADPFSKLPPAMRFDADVRATVTTDAKGRFTFPSLGHGIYTLKARRGTAEATRSVEIAPGIERATIEIALPATGRLVGRILAPEGTSFAELVVGVASQDPANPDKPPPDPFLTGPAERAAVSETGEFTSPWITAGDVRVTVHGPDLLVPTTPMRLDIHRGDKLDLGIVTLAPDADTHRDFDLRRTFPVTVEVQVRVNGEVPPKSVVTLFDRASTRSDWIGLTDVHGIARIPRVPLSTYTVWVRDENSRWTSVEPRELRVEGRAPARFDVDVSLFDGELELRAGDPSTPLANAKVTFELDGLPDAARSHAFTDATGKLRLKLPVGRWTIRHVARVGSVETALEARVEWKTAGPVSRSVNLVPPGS